MSAHDPPTSGEDAHPKKPTDVDAEQSAAFPAPAAGHPDRTFPVRRNSFHRNGPRHTRASPDDGAIDRPHLMAWRRTGRSVPRGSTSTGKL
ncbi:hypothetical protein [Umezawaea sp. Da 62-37]|uniref:hypothetical protein n=1 Tax=Umezawaea sp. Da 62-37 TaxID=3075927 RepID=UPI0028F73857|nr:hypothetical protein [Umezawaea sp. Da 62-37]WNV87227.1 hypothetical protein RM788_02720 [Umezawaea sp. Da 62-37]